jgi:hypothetical protein
MLGSRPVGAADRALTDLTEISSQIEAAALFDARGEVVGSTLADAGAFVTAVQDLVAAATERRSGTLTHLEAATETGSVFVVREGDASIAAVTRPEPTVALVFYDLRTALRAAESGSGDEPHEQRPRSADKGTEAS